MRYFLRLYGAVLIAGSGLLALAITAAVVNELRLRPHRPFWPRAEHIYFGIAPLLVLALIGLLGALLIRLTALPPPGAMRAPPGRMRRPLLVAAAAQFWSGVIGAGCVVLVLVIRWYFGYSEFQNPLVALLVIPLVALAALSVACVGGLLWCSVLRTYADPPPSPASR